uniref:Uncharacterized protein n=1 Tax=Chromera velia CCMP2878 TaxID=1169474 RepID=A0A0G4FV71_9ALVE|eukprot:Cvel_468.t1-p1 / transcript=Cvel_468.t1 / gene=Cvel_468 / organism=Chromera_velia_CCMP2878 / gene_product=hypothetical protein / transcript_product=hypothetical protein / location=Cvel_scaffold15:14893-17685(-) / protein_length=496 / sequence_SO=supercontig / SO=protein_coding / is_pseudo=false
MRILSVSLHRPVLSVIFLVFSLSVCLAPVFVVGVDPHHHKHKHHRHHLQPSFSNGSKENGRRRREHKGLIQRLGEAPDLFPTFGLQVDCDKLQAFFQKAEGGEEWEALTEKDARTEKRDTIALLQSGQVTRFSYASMNSTLENVIQPFLQKGVDVDVFHVVSTGKVEGAEEDNLEQNQRLLKFWRDQWEDRLKRMSEELDSSSGSHGVARLVLSAVTQEGDPSHTLNSYLSSAYDLDKLTAAWVAGGEHLIFRVVPACSNLQKGIDALECIEKKQPEERKYKLIVRDRTDNFFWTPMDAEKMLQCGKKEVFLPDCRHWGGLTDKLAVVGQDARWSYFHVLQSGRRVFDEARFVNVEELLKNALEDNGVTVREMDPSETGEISHVLLTQVFEGHPAPLSGEASEGADYCFRSGEECVVGDALVNLQNSKPCGVEGQHPRALVTGPQAEEGGAEGGEGKAGQAGGISGSSSGSPLLSSDFWDYDDQPGGGEGGAGVSL